MGLLDQLSNLNPEQTQGLLAAAAQMLQASGPSRTPMSFGQTLGAGINGFQSGYDAATLRKAQLAQAAQEAQLKGLQIEDLTGSLGDKALVRNRQAQIQAELMGQNAGQAPQQVAPSNPATQITGSMSGPVDTTAMASAMPGGSMSPKIGGPDWMQAYQAQQATQPQNSTAQNAPAAAPPIMPSAGSTNTTEAYANRLLKEAEVYSKYGDFAGADQRYQAAAKLLPQIDKIEPATDPQTGKLVNVMTFKDGTQKISAFGVKPDFRPVDQGGKVTIQDFNALTPGQSFAKTMTPGETASNNLGWARFNFEKNQADDGTGPLTQDAITNAAKRYNFDGTLPQMGMGKAAAAGRSAILNKAAELAGDTGATGGRDMQLANKGGAMSQAAAVKAFDSGKQGNTVRSFNVAISHLDTLANLANALDNQDVTAFNRAANFYKEQTGNPAPNSFNAAKKIVGDEIVKAIVGSGGGVADREEAARTISAAASPAQLKGVIKTYQDLMVGQLGGLERQYQASTKRDDFNKYLSGRAQEIYKTHQDVISPTASSAPKTATLADIAVTAQRSGKTTAEVTKALRDAGYTIGGQ